MVNLEVELMASRLTEVERETHLMYNMKEPTVTIVTAIPKDILQLKRKGYTLTAVDHEFHTFTAPKRFISFRTIVATEVESTRKLSEAQLEKLKKGREKHDSTRSTKDNI